VFNISEINLINNRGFFKTSAFEKSSIDYTLFAALFQKKRVLREIRVLLIFTYM